MSASVPGRCLPHTPRTRGRHPRGRHPLGRHPPLGRPPPGRHPSCPVHAGIRSTSGWDASHWNAYLFTLHGTGTRPIQGTGTGTIGNNGSWSLSLSRTSVNISTWYYTFHLVPVQVPVPCSLHVPQLPWFTSNPSTTSINESHRT